MIFGYARVSTKTQARDGNSLDAQQAALTAAGAEKIYTDTFTGTKMDRPEWDRLRAQLRRGDVLLPTGELRYTVPPVLVARVERRCKAVYFAYLDHSDRAETDVMLQNEYGTYRLTKIQRFLPQAQAVSQRDTK